MVPRVAHKTLHPGLICLGLSGRRLPNRLKMYKLQRAHRRRAHFETKLATAVASEARR
jgi:hypothetical protein